MEEAAAPSHSTPALGASGTDAAPERQRVTREGVHLGNVAALRADPWGYMRVFHELLFAEPALRGRVLDIGCGKQFPPPLAEIAQVARQVDGLDPSREVHQHPGLAQRWQGQFGECEVPRASYDLAYAFNVVEHVDDARGFFQELRRVLKPGGIFWALTPNGTHPFCPISRTMERLGLKGRAASKNAYVNDYPAFYRMNTPRQVLRGISGLGFASARFVYIPCANWDHYFPRMLRWAPHLYDAVLGSRIDRFKVVIAYRLELDR